MSLKKKAVGMIHSVSFTIQTVQKYLNEILPDVEVYHMADDTIQKDYSTAEIGTIPKGSYFRFINYARYLQEAGADLIILACSTFNRAVEYARPVIETTLLQIDRPMMEKAVKIGGTVGLVATLPTTVPSSERLLRATAEEFGVRIKIKTVLCEQAFKLLRQGDQQGHNDLLVNEIRKLSEDVDSIVLAQLSMSVLEDQLSTAKVPVFNSGRTGIEQARAILSKCG